MKTYQQMNLREFDRLCCRFYYLRDQLTRPRTGQEQAEMERLGEVVGEMERDWERAKPILMAEYNK